ncbi:hypothetical protein Pelo_17450 [Pelomyxa schiedti]|nr:hypothetical protein Pelo_17450 [Pelomyxa schiedti]
MWRHTSGLSHTQLANHILRGSWVNLGWSQKALCTKCNMESGEPVAITLWSLPESSSSFGALSHSKEVFTFNLIPKCSSSRAHLHSQIALLVNTIPGIPSFSSNPISLCARERHKISTKLIASSTQQQQHSQASSALESTRKPIRLLNPFNTELPAEYLHVLSSFEPPGGKPVRITQGRTDPGTVLGFLASELTFLNTASSRQPIVDSRSVPRLAESTIAAIPERIRRRPAIFVMIIGIKDENFVPLHNILSEYQVPLDFSLQSTRLSNNLYVMTIRHKSVENFCYSSYALSQFARGHNPFHIDFTRPNPIITFIGWANNTFAQTM